jgi:serine/threonine protein kinase
VRADRAWRDACPLAQKICPACKNEFAGGEVFCPNDGSRLATPSQLSATRSVPGADPLVGLTVDDRYEILRRIGEGGMGIVYEAEHTKLGKRVALKVLRDDFSSRPEVVERFRQEAKSASRIGNAHIVDISDFGEMPNRASYFVMELLEGDDLANVLAASSTLPLERAANIVLQCCRALSAAHQKGIVHRDMKPENIFLTVRDDRPDFVKIVDFGIAKMSDIETKGAPGRKLTKTGMIFGTPEYMSPEQAAGKPNLDHRVDIYALGVILYEMLTGRVPFVGDTFMGVLTQHMFEPVPKLSVANPSLAPSPAIEAFVAKALAKEPSERFASCDEMARALEQALEGQVIPVELSEVKRPTPPEFSGARRSAPTMAEFTPKEPSRALGRIVGVVALLAIGVGAYLALGPGGAPEIPVAAAPDAGPREEGPREEEAAAAPPDVGPPDVPAPAVTPPPEVDAGPRRVSIRFETNPTGARVWVVDRGDVCTETPCSFELPAGEEVVVRAARGRARGELRLTPTEGMAPVLLRLVARPVEEAVDDRPGGGGTGGTGGGDLKVPDIFSRPR